MAFIRLQTTNGMEYLFNTQTIALIDGCNNMIYTSDNPEYGWPLTDKSMRHLLDSIQADILADPAKDEPLAHVVKEWNPDDKPSSAMKAAWAELEQERAELEKAEIPIPWHDVRNARIVLEGRPRTNAEKHRDICAVLHDTYVKKNADYGDSFVLSYQKHGIVAAIVRMEDKMNRITNLAAKEDRAVLDESIRDSLLDLSNYAIMTVMALEDTKDGL